MKMALLRKEMSKLKVVPFFGSDFGLAEDIPNCAEFVLLSGADYNRASFFDDPHVLKSQSYGHLPIHTRIDGDRIHLVE